MTYTKNRHFDTQISSTYILDNLFDPTKRSCSSKTLKAETHDPTNRCETSRGFVASCASAVTRLLALILSLRYVARIQTSLNSCDRSQIADPVLNFVKYPPPPPGYSMAVSFLSGKPLKESRSFHNLTSIKQSLPH